MSLPDLVQHFIEPLETVRVPYMLAVTSVDRGLLSTEIARRGLEAQWQECQPPPLDLPPPGV